jgi:iron complex outermembrane receptor protein
LPSCGFLLKAITLEIIGGSYGLRSVFSSINFGDNMRQNNIELSQTQADGYRQQSAMRRSNLAWHSKIKANEKQTLMAHFWYTDLEYQTPGALTQQEFDQNPKAARPAVGILPSAEQAHAAIYQKNVLAGFVNEQKLGKSWQNTTALYGSFSQIKNPAIRNYEHRSEPHFGGRSFFKFQQLPKSYLNFIYKYSFKSN